MLLWTHIWRLNLTRALFSSDLSAIESGVCPFSSRYGLFCFEQCMLLLDHAGFKIGTTLRQQLKWNYFPPSLFISLFLPFLHTDTPNINTRGHFHMLRKKEKSCQLGPKFTSKGSWRRSELQYEWTRCFMSVKRDRLIGLLDVTLYM